MQSCLGVYIEGNLIKYAKVQKEKENIKVISFGTKFYENLEQAITQIVSETNSEKIPISINTSGEQYDYFELFALLNKQAIKKSIDIEFEMACDEKGIDKDSMEKRYIFALNQENPNKMKAINVSISKKEIEQKKNLFSKYNLTAIEPLPVSITNLIKLNSNQNELIVNMEEQTTLTFLQNGQIETIEILHSSINQVLDEISKSENSESKAYEILKNTTITSQEMDSFQEGNEYLDVIVPVLFNMINEIKEKISLYGKPIDKIYFSGTGIVINNIDMYFQDRLNGAKCEIIKPAFINSQSLKIGIKDYIEVNSAISVALNGLGIGIASDLNFGTRFGLSSLELTKGNGAIKEATKEKLSAFEKMVIRLIAVCAIFVICYAAIANNLITQMDEKQVATEEKIVQTNESITEMTDTLSQIEDITEEYEDVIDRLNNKSTDEDATFTDTDIPNFLTKLSTTIPTEVKLVSVENTENRHFVIQARSSKYQQLGYFQAILKVNNILTDVSASTGVKYHDEETDEDYILITIEGDLV